MRRGRASKRGRWHFLSLLVAGVDRLPRRRLARSRTSAPSGSDRLRRAWRCVSPRPNADCRDYGHRHRELLDRARASVDRRSATRSSVSLSPAPMVSRPQRLAVRPNRSNPAGAGTGGDGGRRRADAGTGGRAGRSAPRRAPSPRQTEAAPGPSNEIRRGGRDAQR